MPIVHTTMQEYYEEKWFLPPQQPSATSDFSTETGGLASGPQMLEY